MRLREGHIEACVGGNKVGVGPQSICIIPEDLMRHQLDGDIVVLDFSPHGGDERWLRKEKG